MSTCSNLYTAMVALKQLDACKRILAAILPALAHPRSLPCCCFPGTLLGPDVGQGSRQALWNHADLLGCRQLSQDGSSIGDKNPCITRLRRKGLVGSEADGSFEQVEGPTAPVDKCILAGIEYPDPLPLRHNLGKENEQP